MHPITQNVKTLLTRLPFKIICWLPVGLVILAYDLATGWLGNPMDKGNDPLSHSLAPTKFSKRVNQIRFKLRGLKPASLYLTYKIVS